MGLKDRLKRGQQKTGLGRRVLVCPECGAEFVVWGDAAVEYLCADWVQGNAAVAHGIDLDAAALVERGTPPTWRPSSTTSTTRGTSSTKGAACRS